MAGSLRSPGAKPDKNENREACEADLSPKGEEIQVASLQIEALLIRPIVATSAGGTRQTAALQIVAKNQDRFLIVLSGEGMKGLIEDMQTFLEENRGIAESKSQARQ
jgi:hypothetical protein